MEEKKLKDNDAIAYIKQEKKRSGKQNNGMSNTSRNDDPKDRILYMQQLYLLSIQSIRFFFSPLLISVVGGFFLGF